MATFHLRVQARGVSEPQPTAPETMVGQLRRLYIIIAVPKDSWRVITRRSVIEGDGVLTLKRRDELRKTRRTPRRRPNSTVKARRAKRLRFRCALSQLNANATRRGI